ncbi:conserved hypothetical protein [Sporisorium reilianum SRZ2]|uniref:Uncharacterized protein n=1 Tax=Sporisorium reilianum (strain SRZ2) TaxID=999809 RepID=E6ZUL5_SPORE|nr:conserved hypothetical protein [Sporisorium reilianum SRZ2]
MPTRPSLSHRSISAQPPLYDPSSAPQSGTRLRGSKAVSGALMPTGAQLPYSPLLPLPPASTSKLDFSRSAHVDADQSENAAPFSRLDQHGNPVSPSALAARRLARRGVSEGFPFHSSQMKPTRSGVLPSAFSHLSPKIALRLDIAAASEVSGQPAASRSAGMIRSYSLPVATQAEHDEQQRIMALGLSPVSRHAADSSWWQYGWPSPGGVNHRHVHHAPAAPVPEFVGKHRGPSQSKLSSVLTPIADSVVDTAAVSSQATSRPSSRSSKTRSSCSPKMKSKHVPSIHQHTFQNASSSPTSSRRSSASMSPKPGRSPLSMMSINLPALDQQREHAESLALDDDDDDESVDDAATTTPAEAAFDIEMDALNQRFAEWSRSQAATTPCARTSHTEHQDDYFNLVHDDERSNAFLGVGGGSDTSDEARTPRASSPRPLSKAALHHRDHHRTHPQHLLDATEPDQAFAQNDRWSGSFDFIHPDHLV